MTDRFTTYRHACCTNFYCFHEMFVLLFVEIVLSVKFNFVTSRFHCFKTTTIFKILTHYFFANKIGCVANSFIGFLINKNLSRGVNPLFSKRMNTVGREVTFSNKCTTADAHPILLSLYLDKICYFFSILVME